MNDISGAVELLHKSIHTTAFTGAGISVESGIPPFRGPDGIWAKYDPKILEIEYFSKHPDESWKAIRKIFYDHFEKAVPNSAHKAIAELEQMGIVKAVITQNIDNLHQLAGNKTVFEYHGNYSRLICTQCGKFYSAGEAHTSKLPPRCEDDNAVLKPDFIFFGEMIPQKANAASYNETSMADVFLLIGTTGEVMPANLVPRMAKQKGAQIIEVNPEKSSYTRDITDIFLQGRAGEILPEIVRAIKKLRS